MSIAQQKKIEELERRIQALEKRLEQDTPPVEVSGRPQSTLTLPEKRKSA